MSEEQAEKTEEEKKAQEALAAIGAIVMDPNKGMEEKLRAIKQGMAMSTAMAVQFAGSDATSDQQTGVTPFSAGLVDRNVAYASWETMEDEQRNKLDVFYNESTKGAPCIVFVHGGMWVGGDKAVACKMAARFVQAGYVFVAINTRMLPDFTLTDYLSDGAEAVAWVHRNAERYGGDPSRIFLMGHSAGCHQVATLGTNGQHLQRHGLDLPHLRGVICLDTAAYDVPKLVENATPAMINAFPFKFHQEAGGNLEDVSPFHHVSADKAMPPFIIFISDGRPDGPHQPVPFGEKLRACGKHAEVHEAKGRDHDGLAARLGEEDDESTRQILDFLKQFS